MNKHPFKLKKVGTCRWAIFHKNGTQVTSFKVFYEQFAAVDWFNIWLTSFASWE